jgi:hypothetical protein
MESKLSIKDIFSQSFSFAYNRRYKVLRIRWPYLLLVLTSFLFSAQIQGAAELVVFYILITATSVLSIVEA